MGPKVGANVGFWVQKAPEAVPTQHNSILSRAMQSSHDIWTCAATVLAHAESDLLLTRTKQVVHEKIHASFWISSCNIHTHLCDIPRESFEAICRDNLARQKQPLKT